MRHTRACSFLALMLMAATAGAAVVVPIEVMGPAGTVVAVTVTIPPAAAAGADRLWLQAHNLSYADKASVQVNGSAWMSLSNSTTTVAQPGLGYGGIGGAFSTLKLTLALPAGTVVAGSNTIRFRFDRTDGVSSGFRILALDLLAGAVRLLPPGTCVADDPSHWSAPAGGDVSRGDLLWESAPLRESPLNPGTALVAHCSDCHARDGRDLKFFNYSNQAIVARAGFHGLSAQDGADIAAYIRSLDMPSPGRPWNPPYQPGPGLDARPIADWSAGAGVEWALERDQDTFGFIFPAGVTAAAIDPAGSLNTRETPIMMQLPDWNHWLPRIHPLDAWGDEWRNDKVFGRYETLRAKLAGFGTDVHSRLGEARDDFAFWSLAIYDFRVPRTEGPTIVWTPALSQKIYSNRLWEITKLWEMMHEFELEGDASRLYGSYAEARGWLDGTPFMVSPFQNHVPTDANGIDSGLTTEYLSNAWYDLQLVLFGHRWSDPMAPFDWPYIWGHIKDLEMRSGIPEIARMVRYLVKSSQDMTNGHLPDAHSIAWNPTQTYDVCALVNPAWEKLWSDTPAAMRAAVTTAMLRTWFARTSEYTIDELVNQRPDQGGVVYGLRGEVPHGSQDSALVNKIWFSVCELRKVGVDEALLQQLIDYAQLSWPRAGWDALRSGNVTPRLYARVESTSLVAPAQLEFIAWNAGTHSADRIDVLNGESVVGSASVVGNGEYRVLLTGIGPGTYRLHGRARIAGGFVDSGPETVIVTGSGGTPLPTSPLPNLPPSPRYVPPAPATTGGGTTGSAATGGGAGSSHCGVGAGLAALLLGLAALAGTRAGASRRTRP